MWRHMTSFSLAGAEIKGRDLLTILAFQMPALSVLILKDIELTDWCWEGVFKGLAAYCNIEGISMPSEPDGLRHREHRPYIATESLQPEHGSEEWSRQRRYVGDLMDYITGVGRHPSLPPEADARDADRYLDDYYGYNELVERDAKFARYKRAWGMPMNEVLTAKDRRLAVYL